MTAHLGNKERELAREKFQIVAAAYELLSDASKRTSYDRSSAWAGATGGASPKSSWKEDVQQASNSGAQGRQRGSGNWWEQQAAYRSHTHAQDMWTHFVTDEDKNILWQCIKDYQDDVRDDMMYAVQCANRGEWQEAADAAKAHSGLLIGAGVPLVAVLRFPWLIGLGLKFFFGFQARGIFFLTQAMYALGT